MNKKIIFIVLVIILIGFGLIFLSGSNENKITKGWNGVIVKTLQVNNANIYIVETNGKQVMIDSGNPGDSLAVDNAIKNSGVDPSEIDLLIVTHGHDDHAGTAAFLKRKYAIPTLAGLRDKELLENGETGEVCPTGLLAKLISASKPDKSYDAVSIDHYVSDTLHLDSLGLSGKVFQLPGHTEGSVIYQIDELLFVGDLIRGGLINPNEPTLHFFMCDEDDNMKDIKTLLTIQEIKVWFPGHFGSLSLDDVNEYTFK